MLLRVRIRELLSTALLEAPLNVNTSDQEKWGANERAKKIPGGMLPVETPLIKVPNTNVVILKKLHLLKANLKPLLALIKKTD